MAVKLMQVYIKCHYILRTLQGDLEDRIMRHRFCSQRVYKDSKARKNYREYKIQGYIIHRDCAGHQNSEGRRPQLDDACWENFQDWVRPTEGSARGS